MLSFLLVILGSFIMIVAVVFVDQGERRIPVQYAKRMVGRKMYGGQSTHIPMRVNSSGVMPLIFASAMMQFPGTILAMVPAWSEANLWWQTHFNLRLLAVSGDIRCTYNRVCVLLQHDLV